MKQEKIFIQRGRGKKQWDKSSPRGLVCKIRGGNIPWKEIVGNEGFMNKTNWY
jgi:hypothetical protein